MINRMEKGEIVSMKELMSSLNACIHWQKNNLTLVEENIEVLKASRKREKISLLKNSLASLVERMKLMNSVSMAIMENTDAESANYKKAESGFKKLSDDVKKATKDVDALIDEVEKEINAKEAITRQ